MAGNRDVGRRGSKCRTKADLYEQASCEIDYYFIRLIIFLTGPPITARCTTTVTTRREPKVFQNAYGRLENIVMPILTAWLQSDGGVAWNMGAGLIVNEDGDFITAAHVLTCISRPPEAGNPPSSYTTKFGTTEAVFDGGYIHEELDFGWGKLKGYTPSPNHQYPVFRSGEVLPGELLCRIGYPFIEEGFQPRWNNRTFEFYNIDSLPQFINEALVSRFVDFPYMARAWMETSSPGLGGQSGGPVVDEYGLVCGIQVNTRKYPIATAEPDWSYYVGRAVTVMAIRAILDQHNVPYLSR